MRVSACWNAEQPQKHRVHKQPEQRKAAENQVFVRCTKMPARTGDFLSLVVTAHNNQIGWCRLDTDLSDSVRTILHRGTLPRSCRWNSGPSNEFGVEGLTVNRLAGGFAEHARREPLRLADSLSHLDDDFAFRTSCFDVGQRLFGQFKGKDAIDHGTDDPGIDERGDFA